MSRQLTSKLDRWVRLIVITGMVLGAFGQPTTSYAQPVLNRLAQAETATPTGTPPTETETPTPEQITATPTTDVLQITEVPTDVVGTVTAEPTMTVTVTATPLPTGTITSTITPEPTPTPVRTIPPDILELLPPGLPIIEIKDSAEDGSQTVSVGRDGAALFFANNRVVVVAKPGTFSEDVRVVLKPSLIARPEPTPLPTSVVPTEQSEEDTSLASIETPVTSETNAPIDDSAEIANSEFGTVASPAVEETTPIDEGEVIIPIPATPTPEITFPPDAPAELQAASVGTEIQFSVTAQRVADGKVVDTFDVPAQFIVDLRDLPGVYASSSRYLRYQDAADPVMWHRISTVTHDEVGLISAETNHFSNWSTGDDPGAWKWRWQPPSVSEFSGAATYQYPIEIPPGRGGLTPNVGVSYSSRGLDGLFKSNHEQGMLGLGWSVGNIEISRDNVGMYCCQGDGPRLVLPDSFTLALNGQSYPLTPDTDLSVNPLRYYVQGGPEISVQRVYTDTGDVDPFTDQYNWYWVVKTANGTVYRLGYTADSETRQNCCVIATDSTRPTSGTRWRVDTITDVNGNQIQYTYTKWTKSDTYPWFNINSTPQSGTAYLSTEMAQVLDIYYNFTAQSTAGSNPYVYEPVAVNTHQSRIKFIDNDMGDTDHRLNRIEIYHLNLSNVLREIAFTTSDIDYDAASQCTQDTMTRVVTAITEKGSLGGALPQTTFTYVKTPHNGSSEWCYAYLEEVNNGFGGKAKFVYSHDGRVSYPDAGYSYFVTQAQTTDGAHGTTYSTIDYTYDAPCYDHSQGLFGTNPTGGLDCTTRDPQVAGTFVRTVGGLTGFNRTTALYKDYGGQPLRQTITWFGQWGSRIGTPIRQLTLDPLVTVNIPNSGFEDGNNNWTSVVTSSAVQTLTTSTTNPHGGRDSLQIDVSGISALNQNYVESTALSNWATGQRYSVSAYLRSDSADLEMCLSVFGSLAGGGTYESTAACAATTQNWQLVEGSVQIPGNASTLKVLIRARKNGRYFIDDVFLGRILQASESEYTSYANGTTSFDKVVTAYGTTYAPDGLSQTTRVSNGYNGRGDLMSAMQYGAEVRLLNPSFEQGLAGWYSYCSGSGCTAVAEGYSPSGFFGSTTRLKLAGSAAGGVVQDVSGLTVGASYTARVRVRSVTGAGDFRLWIHNANSTTYCGGSCGNTDVSPSGQFTLSPVGSSTWQEVNLTFTAPATGRVRIHLYYPTANSGTVYVDEVSLAKTADVGDERTTVNWYAEDTTGSTWLTSLPFASLVYKGINGHWCNADLMTQSTQYYDGYSTVTDPFGQSATSLTKGQLTMTAKGMVYSCGTANFTTEQYSYDTWGNPKQVTDAGGHSIYTQYDSTLNLYPTSITTTVNSNVLSQTLQYYGVAGVGDQATNYPRGTLKQRQDANGQITTYTYDEFGRVKTIVRPGDSATYPSATYTYTTSSYPFALQTDVRETSGCSTCVYSTYEYYDGLGQLLQTRAEMATAGQFTVNKVTYDSLGRAVRTTVPEQASGSTYVAATGSEQASRPVFDSWGRTVAAIAPDGTVSSVGYTDQTVVNADANGHYRINTLDTFGRTIRVDETITTTQTFTEIFTGTNAFWTYSCQGASAGCQSIDSGTLKNIGTGSNWNATVYRAGGDTISGTGSVSGIRVEFKVASGSLAVLALQNTSNIYSRFGINLDSSRIFVQYNNDATWTYPTDLINPIQLNTWYVLELRVLPDGQGLIVVSERDNPAKSSSFIAPMPPGGSYHFQQWVHTGTVWMDNYSEFQPTYQPTKYTYNALDQLTVVTDTLNNTTVISYNVLGQKYEMLDPDMGFWKYGYDLRGNLSWQKDARQQQLCFTYDELNRLTAKHQLLSGSDCATDPKALLASFGYDNAANLGKGQRTSMSDATGTAEWRYDNRGRVISETRTITATALNTSYTTLMNYDALDRVITTTYPTGEIVTNTYNAQGLLATVRGLNDGLYVNGLTYDVASRLTNMALNNGLVTTYTYASWNDRGGRLLRIQTGASLLDFNYAYDAVGNIRTITDSANSNQVLTFGYDALDRLTSASTSLVGNGQYTQTWGYNAIGNITTTTLITSSTQTNTYTYTATAGGTCSATQTVKPHAASAMGTNSYTYDCNGNMLTRGENGVTYQQQFNVENQLTVVTDTATTLVTTFYYDGDGRRVLLTRSDGTKIVYPSGLMEVEYVGNSPVGNYVVDRFDDPSTSGLNCTSAANDCSLRAAIALSNANSNADVIAVPAGTYTLTRTGTADDNNTNGDLDITNPVTITGAGANVATINTSSGWTERVFHVLSGKTLNLIGVTVTGGNQSGAVGGGVYNQSGTVTISNTTILSNTATDGGGLYSSGVLTLLNSSVLTNTSTGSNGGGGLAQNGSTADLTNVTFSGNRAQAGGGGVYLTSSGTLTITNGTVVSNTADYDANGTGDGGGLRRGSGTLNLRNTIVAGNTDGNNSDPDCDGTMTSLNYNHIGSTTGCSFTSQSNDAINSSANLAVLANNGGTTLTHLPNPGSPVTNTANAAVCPTLDQRGYGRNGTCDKGAAEYNGLVPTSILTKTYYFAGARLVAMREITTTGTAGTLYYLHQDHLGSTSLTTNNSGVLVSKQLFYAYGEARWSSGTTPTTIGYTGQRKDSGLGSLMFYNARYYSPYLNRFVSADGIVPGGGPQQLNRYSYANNNPLLFVDPTGHCGEAIMIFGFIPFWELSDCWPVFELSVPVIATVQATATTTGTPTYVPSTPGYEDTDTPTPRPTSTATQSSSSTQSLPKIGDAVSGFRNTYYVRSRTTGQANIDFELRATGKPFSNLGIEVNGKEFDWFDGTTLLDAKNTSETKSIYDARRDDKFWQNVMKPKILADAREQLARLKGSGFTKIEWRVAQKEVAEALQALFDAENIGITVLDYSE